MREIVAQARVKPGVRLNLREEPYVGARVDGQLLEHCVVSILPGEPEGAEQFVQIEYVAYCSLKQLEIINRG